ncbi:prolyl oligopeptidase family serine peptidase [Dyadobacter sp. CY326]|uniref:prolyl oligopeptidase family serine peptidase n=1 Tax=Dyadobacter sp. CY326 TaxID=2907300 RepID=UPI001F2DFB1C|nr:prolyl oligopeptidase family serine peptidase [Dyadobacter sp. CY326]MCE7066150.1 prolyl oligopeptidase family serine peptidase [Dyadobacter sp. CY326]
MKQLVLLLLGLLPTTFCFAQSDQVNPALPASPKRPVIDTYFGKKVTDNYRWLEDMTKPETVSWFKSQGDYSNVVLDQIPGRNQLIETFTEYDKLLAVRYGEIIKRGNLYFYRKTLPSEKVGKIYVREGKSGSERLIFDPEAFEKGKTYSISAFTPSPDGKKMVIGLQEGGGEYSTLRTLDVATKTFGPGQISSVFGGYVVWLPDASGFVYTPDNSSDPNDPKAAIDTKCRLHKLGDSGKTDREIFSRTKYPDLKIKPEQIPDVFYSEDHTQLYGHLGSVDWRNDVWVAAPADLNKPAIPWKRLLAPLDSIQSFVKIGDQLFMNSLKSAPNGQIIVTDANNPNLSTATIVVAESKLNITQILATRDYLFVNLSDGINQTIQYYDPKHKVWSTIPMPIKGTMRLESYEASKSNEVNIFGTSWNNPGTFYDFDPQTKKLEVNAFHVQMNYPGVADLVVEEIEIPSHDGVMVPLSLVYRKDLRKDGSAICLMHGYGAYGISATPFFSRQYLALMNKGVLIAMTHPRGGAEKGLAWHKAGFKTTKPNTWKDFIASGDYLVKNGYTSKEKLIGMGTSAGGILIGRAITERPDLFAAAINNVGISNPLRFELTPNGPGNLPELGTVKDSTESMALYEMDSFHHVKDGEKYPAVINVAGMNDPRVIAWQPGKFAAALQNSSSSGKPVLMQVNYDNGHFTEDKTVSFRNYANMYAFCLWQAGHPDFQVLGSKMN